MITKDDLLKISSLSKLCVEDWELESLCARMQSIVRFASIVDEADVCEETSVGITDLQSVFREDRVEESLSVCDVLKNVGHRDGDLFSLEKRS